MDTSACMCRLLRLLVYWCLHLASCNQLPPGWATYDGIVSDFWRWRLQEVPEFATSVGVHEYDDRLERFTFEAFTHRKNKCDEFLFRIDQLDESSMSTWQWSNIQLLRHDIQTYVNGYRWSRLATLNPVNYLEGIHKDYSFWLDAMKFEDEEDFRIYIRRLRALASQVYEQLNLMRESLRAGWMNHRISVAPVLEELESLARGPTETPFYRPFNTSLAIMGFSPGRIERIREEGYDVIYDHVLPAYRKLRYFISQEYLPNTRPDIGIYSLPGGEEYYQDCIRWYIGADLAPLKLHKMALEEVEHIRQNMDKIRRKTGYINTLSSFMRYTQRAPTFYHLSEHKLLGEYREIMSDIPPRLSWIFRNITLLPHIVQPMPFDGPAGVSMPPSDDVTMPAVFFANVRRPHTRPKWKMTQLVLSEALPGHHFQLCYSLDNHVPRYRRVLEYRKMYSIPFQFPFHSAFREGWSLYAGSLGKELGLYEDPYDQYGQLYAELLMVVKVVVDTGIHAFGWTRDHSVSYLTTTTGMERQEAEAQVDTFITLPGQALADFMGFLQIRNLRQHSRNVLGEHFRLKEFHHHVLKQGAISLSSLGSQVARWLQHKSIHFTNRLSSGGQTWHTPLIWIQCLLSFLLYLSVVYIRRWDT